MEMGEIMNRINSKGFSFRILEIIQSELKEIETLNSVYEVKDRIHKLLDFIEQETLNNKTVFEEELYSKIKETNGINPELNTYLYLLYRNLAEDKISIHEARRLYEMYLKEYGA